MVKSEGRGDIGVRFDKLNELRDGKVSELAALSLRSLSLRCLELAERSKGRKANDQGSFCLWFSRSFRI